MSSSTPSSSQVYIEQKHDGFRLQIHYERATDTLRLFYRSGADATLDVGQPYHTCVRTRARDPNPNRKSI